MKKVICIFTTKNSKPDLYINILGYFLARFQKTRIARIYLINIFDFALDRDVEEIKATTIKKNIKEQLSSLRKSEYKKWNFKEDSFGKEKSVQLNLSESSIKLYEGLSSILSNDTRVITKAVLFEELDLELKLLLQQSFGEYIFDITSLINRYMVEVSLFLLENDYEISSFEMLRRLTHNESDLIHNLKKGDFNYLNLGNNSYKVVKTKYLEQINSSNDEARLFERWLKQIASARTESVINEIRDYALKNDDKELLNEITTISGRWQALNRENSQDTVRREDFTIEINKINKSLTTLIYQEFGKR